MKQAPRIWACAAALLAAWPAFADMPVLTITGMVEESSVALTLEELRDLPQHQLTTSTTVTDGTPVFEGFLMRDLLDEVQAQGDTVIAHALNDYRMEIPVSDFVDFDVMGALSMDGMPLNPRDKGPVWIVYPRDDHRELQDIRFDTRWVWQLVSLHVQ
ncbi:molybdopterin-dependent oxidoreductase [Roseinatronobacter sp. S2]|uniref:molybdopterin-dependent oxidoreductase n=1 Tax=Roseinatronobacter sp. S2 TaxID=3035471 RepID=UPI00240EE324|nr:molybdopterin-dependent oxidoreductase [Roseinatronobacter sp. S2]WFE74963.1 molybdopterin-dependent oxidoreductase [Roseinatronobacter sp. S2]